MLCGCATAPLAPHDISLDGKDERGVVVVSCSMRKDVTYVEPFLSREPLNVTDFYIYATNKKSGMLSLAGYLPVWSFASRSGDFGKEPLGRVYALRLKPGEYRFLRVEAGNLRGNISPPRTFVVAAHSINYIGNIELVATEVGKYRFDVKDMRSRDLPVFLKQYPNVTEEQVKSSIME